MGVIFALFPVLGAILFVVLIITTVLSDFVAIGTLFLLLPPLIYMMTIGGYHWGSYVLISLYILLSLYKHSNNFIAIFKKEEKGLKEALKK